MKLSDWGLSTSLRRGIKVASSELNAANKEAIKGSTWHYTDPLSAINGAHLISHLLRILLARKRGGAFVGVANYPHLSLCHRKPQTMV